MFERYTEGARRIIFFARYEASQYCSPTIETEHLLLGVIRQDRNVTVRFLGDVASADVRKQIEALKTIRDKTSTSIDLPLSSECKRILAYAAEEAVRLNQQHIGAEHLFLGILREANCTAAQILSRRGLELARVRQDLASYPMPKKRYMREAWVRLRSW
jgi:ATP-dependent Clp protease ATP-binding subunit ClpC